MIFYLFVHFFLYCCKTGYAQFCVCFLHPCYTYARAFAKFGRGSEVWWRHHRGDGDRGLEGGRGAKAGDVINGWPQNLKKVVSKEPSVANCGPRCHEMRPADSVKISIGIPGVLQLRFSAMVFAYLVLYNSLWNCDPPWRKKIILPAGSLPSWLLGLRRTFLRFELPLLRSWFNPPMNWNQTSPMNDN